MNHSFEDIYNSYLVKTIIQSLFDNNKLIMKIRPASYVIRLEKEPQDKISRIIILPPKGYTTDKPTELICFPETRSAKIEIKGGVRPENKGFIFLKNCINFLYYLNRDISTAPDSAYAPVDRKNKYFVEELKSCREKFFIVKENGFGFYHGLFNLSNEWLLLILEKEFKFQKQMDIESRIKKFEENDKLFIRNFIDVIDKKGDRIFTENKKDIKKIISMDINKISPVLIEALNIRDEGNHEPCTIFALLLKIGKKNSNQLANMLNKALENNEAPPYYLKELIDKISRF